MLDSLACVTTHMASKPNKLFQHVIDFFPHVVSVSTSEFMQVEGWTEVIHRWMYDDVRRSVHMLKDLPTLAARVMKTFKVAIFQQL